ncbi:MAG: hypothetical protein CFK52_05330 [Chloracidobacterium sp. CP2_5A]|nr:MAG: hypothetical protein CFK52_05330 [Chloracidobacterium sp. CP2_5A]
MRRAGNEDNLQVVDLTRQRLGLAHREATLSPDVAQHPLGPLGTLLIVSDGMGGAAAGEVASEMAVEIVSREMGRQMSAGLASRDAMRLAADRANAAIWDRSQNESAIRGLGATLTAIHLSGHEAVVSQVGDSRAYLIRGGAIRQLTEDQSWANAAKKAGMQVANVPNNVILQALGTQRAVNTDITVEGVQPNDIFLLCSDGLSNKVEEHELLAQVSAAESLDAAAEALVKLANERGGEDNITVLIAQLLPSAAGEASASSRVTQVFASAPSSGDATIPFERGRVTAELHGGQTLSSLSVVTRQANASSDGLAPVNESAAGGGLSSGQLSPLPEGSPALVTEPVTPTAAPRSPTSGKLVVLLALVAVAGIVLAGAGAMLWILQSRAAAVRDLGKNPSPEASPSAPPPVAAPAPSPASPPSNPSSGIGRADGPILDEVEKKLELAERQADDLARRMEGLSVHEAERKACEEKCDQLKKLKEALGRHRRREAEPGDLSVADIEREVVAISKWLSELPEPLRKRKAPIGKKRPGTESLDEAIERGIQEMLPNALQWPGARP